MNKDIWCKILNLKQENLIYCGSNSLAFYYGNKIIVIEKDNGLQIQYRRSPDHSDIVVAEDIIVNKRTVSKITDSNKNQIKKLVIEFLDKL